MATGQIVCLTRCENTPGFPELLRYVTANNYFHWLPEYTVYEQYRDFNMTQYLAKVTLHPYSEFDTYTYYTYFGMGTSVEMAVQEAAYVALTCLRREFEHLENTSFRYFPSTPSQAEGVESATYMDFSEEQNVRIRRLAHLVQVLDQQYRLVRHELCVSRGRLWNLMVAIEPSVSMGRFNRDHLYTVPESVPPELACPDVGGVIPPRGRYRYNAITSGPRRSPYMRQPPETESLIGPRVLMSEFYHDE